MKSKISSTGIKLLKLAFIAGVFLITACIKKNNSVNNLPVLSPGSLAGDVLLSDIAEEVSYLKLDNSILLSNILDVKKSKAGYYIKTRDGLFYFNNQGKYQFQVGKKGKGPDEYTFVEDFAIDEKSQQLFILNWNSVKVYGFSGEFMNSFDTPGKEQFYEMEIHEDRLIFPKGFGFMPQEKDWHITDLNGNPITMKPNHITTGEMRVEYKVNLCFEAENKFFYWNQLNDTIFQVGNRPAAAFLFAKDNLRVTENDLASEENYRNKASWQLLSVLGTNRYLFFDYLLIKDMKKNHTVYDKKKMQHLMLVQEKIGEVFYNANSFDNGPVFIPKSKFFNNNEEHLIGWIDAFKIKEHVASDAFSTSSPINPEKKLELEQLANQLDENDNPVLMMVKLKN
jgi:hypothetical protein